MMTNRPPKSLPASVNWGAIAFAIGLPSLVTFLYFVLLAQSPAVVQQTTYAIGKTVQFTFPAVWVLLIQRQRLRWQRPGKPGMGFGVLFGLAVLGAMMGLYYGWLKPAGYLAPGSSAGQAIVDKVQGFGADSLAKYLALATFYAVFHSLLEEYYWRWFVFGQLRRLVSPATAIVVSSLGFMAHHVILLSIYFGPTSPATLFFSLGVAVGGAVWAWLYYRGDSLYGPWISHLIVDAAIFMIGYDLVKHLFV